MAFVRYTLAGGIATAVHYAVLLGLVEAGQATAGWAAAVGATTGAFVAYLANRHFVFAGSVASHRQALPRFLAVATLGVAISGSVVWLGNEVLGLHYVAAQVSATLLVLALGFQINRAWSFT